MKKIFPLGVCFFPLTLLETKSSIMSKIFLTVATNLAGNSPKANWLTFLKLLGTFVVIPQHRLNTDLDPGTKPVFHIYH